MAHDVGILLIRVIVGAALASHGAQKLFGWFGGHGIKGTGGFFEGLGFHPGTLFATAAGGAEFFGGLLIVLGLGGPLGAVLVGATMLVAIITVHLKNGFFAGSNGVELPLIYAAAAFGLAFAGPGSLSLDHAAGWTALDSPGIAWLGLALAVVGALGNIALRRPAEKSQLAT
ncbi:MAG: oxidoreductase [Candidatus Eremiobacter antarcticus]|nr:DoxX family protein [Candidatus Eremiobacteraeota bacterium]PZR62367.1 MAG: oxidoreductase [Candidatus Eremiobacter sp. RRmetagenome_bin22]